MKPLSSNARRVLAWLAAVLGLLSAFRSATANAATSRRGSRPNRLAEELNHGHCLHHHHLRVLPAHLGLRSPLREGLVMTSLLIVGGVLAVLLLAYLGFALLFPERLS